ncbi:TPA: hypothetical protein ACKRPO_005756 [Pseudomonas aeruginosa]|nr:hypothetical protein [Pseudomonas aeruginosa]
MSAQIIQFPGNKTGGASRDSDELCAMVTVDRMRPYRILSVSTMRALVRAQCHLIKLVRDYQANGKAPSAEEFEEVIWQYAGAVRCIDFAHKFLVVHGKPAGDDDGYEELRRKYRREISNRPPVEFDPSCMDAVGGFDDD